MKAIWGHVTVLVIMTVAGFFPDSASICRHNCISHIHPHTPIHNAQACQNTDAYIHKCIINNTEAHYTHNTLLTNINPGM